MKMITTSSKLFRFILIFIPIFSFLLALHIYLNPENKMKVSISCRKINQTERYCTFGCVIRSNQPAEGRIVVTHTVWASIFEKKIILNRFYNFFIELPRRNYVYYLRGGFYNNSNYGILEGSLEC